ncbi:MAG TPA: carboxymuconolactone decarboxylase family protein [Acidimicrobiales bacterium]|nr:carboxymuconolactone decarboxylase family protein [Acidimicrobiales bacterium]
MAVRPAGPPSVRVPPATGRALGLRARVAAAVAAAATGGERPRLLTTLARNPRLFRRWLPLGATLLLRGDLARADRELVILRTAWRCGSWYEWVQHVHLAGKAGLPSADVERVAAGPEATGWSPTRRLLVRAADELHDRQVITDPTWEELAAVLTERQLIELCLLVGHYEMLALTLNSLGVEPEPTALARLGEAGGTADRLRDRLVAERHRPH